MKSLGGQRTQATYTAPMINEEPNYKRGLPAPWGHKSVKIQQAILDHANDVLYLCSYVDIVFTPPPGTQAFQMSDYSNAIQGSFGKCKGLWRCHYY